jgi:hypothetical protein
MWYIIIICPSWQGTYDIAGIWRPMMLTVRFPTLTTHHIEYWLQAVMSNMRESALGVVPVIKIQMMRKRAPAPLKEEGTLHQHDLIHPTQAIQTAKGRGATVVATGTNRRDSASPTPENPAGMVPPQARVPLILPDPCPNHYYRLLTNPR